MKKFAKLLLSRPLCPRWQLYFGRRVPYALHVALPHVLTCILLWTLIGSGFALLVGGHWQIGAGVSFALALLSSAWSVFAIALKEFDHYDAYKFRQVAPALVETRW